MPENRLGRKQFAHDGLGHRQQLDCHRERDREQRQETVTMQTQEGAEQELT